MNHAPKYLLCALGLTLASCKSLPVAPPAYVPPRIDCEASTPPRVEVPVQPALTEKSVVIWQLFGLAMTEFADDVLMQRVETAVCLKDLREKRVIR